MIAKWPCAASLRRCRILGFIIERANEPLGLVTAARFAEPNFYDVVGVTVTVRSEAEGRMMVRANAIYNNKPIEDPKVYQNFFATLERSLFVTKQLIGHGSSHHEEL